MFNSFLFAAIQDVVFYGVLIALFAVDKPVKGAFLKKIFYKEGNCMDSILTGLIKVRDRRCLTKAAKILGKSETHDKFFFEACISNAKKSSANVADMGYISVCLTTRVARNTVTTITDMEGGIGNGR